MVSIEEKVIFNPVNGPTVTHLALIVAQLISGS